MTETLTKLEPLPSTKLAGGQLSVLGGTVLPETIKEVETLAQYMAKAGSAIPYSMQSNPGECMAVIMDAIAWRMNPWAVARMRYVTKSKDGHLTGGYMSQLFMAVLNTRAPIKGRLVPAYKGEGAELTCTITAETEEGQVLTYESPKIKDISPKNSPLWASDPRQQIAFYSCRAFGRRYFPDLMMGVYDPEEVQEIARMRDVTPKENALDDGDEAPAHVHQGEVMEADKTVKTMIDRETGEITDVEEDMIPMPTIEEANAAMTKAIERPVDEEGQTGLGLDQPDANQIKVNLLKGIAACKTRTDLDAWRDENVEALKDRDIRKAAAERGFELDDQDNERRF